MAKPSSKTASTGRRFQVRVSNVMAREIESLSDRLGVSESALCAMLIAGGLVRFADVLGRPELREVANQQIDEVGLSDVRSAPGFHPAGKPRAELELSSSPPGEEWTGYMRGL